MSANDGSAVAGGVGGSGETSLRAIKPFRTQQTAALLSLPTHLCPPYTSTNTTVAPINPLQLTLPSSVNTTHPLPLHTVAAKITHVKTTNIDGTIMSGGTIKVATGAGPTSTLSGTPIALNSGQTTTASIRAIGTGGQSTQVRVVVPTGIMSQSMIKQLENATTTGRTQITAIPAAVPVGRSVSNASITATYLPRAGVTSVGVASGQRLVAPLRPTSSATVTPTAAGSFVRGTAVSRSTVSQPTTVISPATSTAWMTANSSGQVQLIRTIPHQSRQRIITTQGISTGGGATNTTVGPVTNTNLVGGVTVTGSVMTSNATSTQLVQTQPAGSTIQTIAATQSTGPHSQQQPPPQAYVAVLPQRQHQATLVYAGSAPTSQPISHQQQFNPTVSTTGQRFAVATQLTAASSGTVAGGSTTATRQIRPIVGKSFSTAKLNTTSISIRAPSIPQLTSTMVTSSISSGAPTITAAPTVVAAPTRNTTGIGSSVVSPANVLTTANLPTTRIIQLQQPNSGSAQQLIGPTGRIATNVMLQPIIVNTSSGGKIGIRPPVTMTAKVQPSLTITQLGTISKLPTSGTSTASLQSQNVTASIQSIGSNALSTATALGGAIVSGGSTITNATTGTAQLVNVSQASQLLSSGGGIVTNSAGTSGGATVVPLAIAPRGTITPIKSGNSITVGKVIPNATGTLDSIGGSTLGGLGNQPTSVFISHQRPGISSNNNSLNSGSGGVSVSVSAPGSTPVATSASGTAFLPAGSTIYYESMPANTVQVSSGLSLTTATSTSSTISPAQMVSSAGNLAISSLPFVTHAGGSTTTFTVVPSSTGGRTISQLQLPVSSAGAQLQAVPVRLSSTAVSTELNTTAQLVQAVPGQQIIIPAQQTGGGTSSHPQHMVIPLQTSVKVTSGITGNSNSSVSGSSVGLPVTSTVVPNFLRKRDADGSPIRAAKNLASTLLAMGTNNSVVGGSNIIAGNATVSVVGAASPAGSSISSSSYSLSSVPMSTAVSSLTAEALAKKDRVAGINATSSTRISRADSPASSDGSTTVSANSSPGVEQQIQDNNLVINRMSARNNESNSTHFNPINELYSDHHHSGANVTHSNSIASTPVSSRTATVSLEQQMQSNVVTAAAQRMNGGTFDVTIRKKPRRSTNDSQHSVQSQASLTLPPPSGSSMSNNITNASALPVEAYAQNNGLLLTTAPHAAEASNANAVGNNNHRVNNVPPVTGNKENAKPVEYVLRRPRSCTMLNPNKPTHKLANNHFQRYSDVKPREERRPTVMDLANQTNVMSKINGWKVYHLRSQMEDMVENEGTFYEKLESMLKELEKDKNPELERINELIKGNMQRSKIVVDGINEAQNQIMKIFDHKSHVSDIISRCASKRNFKKREKI